MKLSAVRRALLLANLFNLLVAVYLIIIAIVALVQLRWYHQLTITVKVLYLLTSMTSYFAFFILIVAGLLLISIFVTSSLRIKPAKVYVGGTTGEDAINDTQVISATANTGAHHQLDSRQLGSQTQQAAANHRQIGSPAPGKRTLDTVGGGGAQRPLGFRSHLANNRIVLRDSTIISETNDHHEQQTNTSVCCSILIHLITATCLVLILIIWLFNTGELVRDSISTQLEAAYNKYQFSNRSNYNTIAIDGMQDINDCCGSLDYTDFPHQLRSGLANGYYPGSCCGKYTFGVNVRLTCTAEEVVRQRQTTGCTTILANYYDLISLLVVPVALVSLFVNITIIALITILKGAIGGYQHHYHHYNESEANDTGLEHLFYNQRVQRSRALATPTEAKPATANTTTATPSAMAPDQASSRAASDATTTTNDNNPRQQQATADSSPSNEDRLELKQLDVKE